MEAAIRSQLGLVHFEDIVIEAVRDMVKDEIKNRIRQKLDENPALKNEIREAIGEIVTAKINEAYALLKLTKCGAELGLTIVPKEVRERLEKDIASLLEREVSQVIERI